MEIVVSCICSIVISFMMSNIIGKYYLLYNDKKWQETFDKATEITIEEINKLKK